MIPDYLAELSIEVYAFVLNTSMVQGLALLYAVLLL